MVGVQEVKGDAGEYGMVLMCLVDLLATLVLIYVVESLR
jgi:hypothetical protein